MLKEKYGRFLTVESAGSTYGGIKVLRPQKRIKEQRICDALQWPLVNGKLWMSKKVPEGYRERIRPEMDRFPFWHDDAIDALAYLYDLLKDFVFPSMEFSVKKFKQAEVGVV